MIQMIVMEDKRGKKNEEKIHNNLYFFNIKIFII